MNGKGEVGEEVKRAVKGGPWGGGNGKGGWCEWLGGGLRWAVSGGGATVWEKRWPCGERPRPEGRAGAGVRVAGRSLVEGQSERRA